MNAWLKRCVFNLDLNRESVSEPQTFSGRLFHSLGARYEKATCMCNFVLVGNGMYTVYIVFAGKIKLNCTVYLCVLSIKTIFSNILQHIMFVLSVVSVTLNQKKA